MASSAHFVITFALFILSAFPDFSYAHGNAERRESCPPRKTMNRACRATRTSGVVVDAYSKLITQLVVDMPPPSAKSDQAYRDELTKTSGEVGVSYVDMAQQLVNLPALSPGIDKKLANSIMQNATEVIRAFRSIFPQIVTLLLQKSRTGELDQTLASEIQDTTGQVVSAFTNVFTQLVQQFSKAGGTEKEFADAVLEQSGVVLGGFGNLTKQLSTMPPRSSKLYKPWFHAVMQTRDFVGEAFLDLIKQVACQSPPSTRMNEAYAKAVMQKGILLNQFGLNTVKQLVNIPQPCAVDNAYTSSVKQKTDGFVGAYTEVMELLVSPPSCGMTNDSKADKKRKNAIKKATAKAFDVISDLRTRLGAVFSVASKKSASDKAWKSAIAKTIELVALGNFDILRKLEEMPPTCSEAHDEWAASTLRKTKLHLGDVRIFIDEVLLLQSTGMLKNIDPAQGCELIKASDVSLESLGSVMKLHLASITGSESD